MALLEGRIVCFSLLDPIPFLTTPAYMVFGRVQRGSELGLFGNPMIYLPVAIHTAFLQAGCVAAAKKPLIDGG